ncbi:hypothetical protein [Streptomyces sp. NPDC054842]
MRAPAPVTTAATASVRADDSVVLGGLPAPDGPRSAGDHRHGFRSDATDRTPSPGDGQVRIRNHGTDDRVSLRGTRAEELPARSAAPGR